MFLQKWNLNKIRDIFMCTKNDCEKKKKMKKNTAFRLLFIGSSCWETNKKIKKHTERGSRLIIINGRNYW